MDSSNLEGSSLRQIKLPRLPAGGFIPVALVVLAIYVLVSCIYTVNPEEVGIVLTFGKYVGQTEPGLRFKMPYPVQQVIKVPVQRQLKEEFGFRTEAADVRSRFTTAGLEGESLMLTGDLNVGVVEWTTQYRVSDPYRYIFRVRSATETFRDMNEAVMRTIIGDRSVSEVLTTGRQEIASEVETRLQEMCDQYEIGIRIDQIVLQDVNPPDEVKPSFNEVNQAEQEREQMINEARAEYNRVVPRARGEALQTIQQAEGYAADRVNRSRGDAARFEELLAAYRRAPEVTRSRIYLETLARILGQVKRKIVLDEGLEGVLPLLSLDREVQ